MNNYSIQSLLYKSKKVTFLIQHIQIKKYASFQGLIKKYKNAQFLTKST